MGILRTQGSCGLEEDLEGQPQGSLNDNKLPPLRFVPRLCMLVCLSTCPSTTNSLHLHPFDPDDPFLLLRSNLSLHIFDLVVDLTPPYRSSSTKLVHADPGAVRAQELIKATPLSPSHLRPVVQLPEYLRNRRQHIMAEGAPKAPVVAEAHEVDTFRES